MNIDNDELTMTRISMLKKLIGVIKNVFVVRFNLFWGGGVNFNFFPEKIGQNFFERFRPIPY